MANFLLTKPWKSADLTENNPFSLAFIGQGIFDLIAAGGYQNSNSDRVVVVNEIVGILIKELEGAPAPFGVHGSVGIPPYPPSAYLTHVAFRLLDRCKSEVAPFPKLARQVRIWSRGEIHRQVALITTRSRLADPLQLAYAVMLLATSTVDEHTSPEEKALIRNSLAIFFDSQKDDGTWPLSQPLFHYPAVGNAHCFDYELLAELLRCKPLQDDLLKYMPAMKGAADHLPEASFDLGDGAIGWASGHHPQFEGPESWSTASVYDFVFALDRLVAEAIRRELFAELRTVYFSPGKSVESEEKREFAGEMLDAMVLIGGSPKSLLETLKTHFVDPIDKEKGDVARGGQLSRTTPMSAIFYGPPGTSKTQLAKIIGSYLGWPVLIIDPSYVVQDGLDHVYARANQLFSMLATTEQVVVLLDEFDELGRDRSQEPEVLSRFITTAMLPKLAAINEERKIVFLLATNYLSRFDAAFRRGGRFDMLLQVMPPTSAAKMGKLGWKDVLEPAVSSLAAKKRQEAEGWLGDLTYLETEELVYRLRGADDAHEEIKIAHENGTLSRKNGDKSWKETSKDDESHSRLPPLRTSL